MTDTISAIGTTTGLPTTQEAVASAASEGANQLISSDFETFLRMMTTQLENQDPLDPLDSTDFAVQLATFSGVEQQVLTNERLTALTGQLAASSLSSLSSWIGNQVLTGLDVTDPNGPVDLIAQTEPGAARAEVLVRNEAGLVVGQLPIAAQGGPVQWNGLINGVTAPAGTYRFTAVSYDSSDSIIEETAAQTYQTVVEVQTAGTDPKLALSGGATVNASDVAAVRQAPLDPATGS